jgi:serine protease Do
VTVGKMKDEPQVASAEDNTAPAADSAAHRLLGVQLSALTDDVRQQLGIGDDVKGVVIMDVVEGSPAARQGLQQGDIIEQVARRRVNSPADVDHLVAQAAAKDRSSVLLLVNRQGNELYLAVKVGKA